MLFLSIFRAETKLRS